MKKEIKIIVAVVLSIWFFVMGFELGIYKERKANAEADTSKPVVNVVPDDSTSATNPTTPSTPAPSTPAPTTPSTPAPSTPAPSTPNPSTPAPTEPSAPSADPSFMSKEEITKKVAELVNQVKNEPNMTAVKNENIDVQLTDLSVQSLMNQVNNIVKGIIGDGPTSETYNFSGGVATDSEGNTVEAKNVIPPVDKAFSLTVAGVADAKVQKQGDNTVYTLILVKEDTTIESPVPTHNSVAIGYLDLTSLDIPGVNITQADMHYTGSTVEVTVNAQGKVTKLVNKLPMNGTGAAKIAFVSGTASFEGGLNETWDFTY